MEEPEFETSFEATQDDEKSLKKQEQLEREREKLLADLAENRIDSLKDKVAYILNHYRDARNSDKALGIRLIKTFHRDYVDEHDKISLESLNELPKFYDMQRYRAKIQNEYKLFQADPAIQARRKQLADEARIDFTPEGRIASNIAIFADESKTGNNIVIGSYWIYNKSEWDFIEKRFNEWRTIRNTNKEFHFNRLSGHEEANLAAEFFGEALLQTQLNSLMALVINRDEIRSTKLSTAIYGAIAEMVINGIQSEFDAHRINPPIVISVNKDSEDGTDALELAPMERRILSGVQSIFPNGQVRLQQVDALGSVKFNLVQIADLFTGTINRWVNHEPPNEQGNPKNRLAYKISTLLGISGENGKVQGTGDQCKILYASDFLKTVS